MTISTYQPGAEGIDTYVPISGVTNHGADPYVLVNAGNHGLIKFDLSDIPSTAECVGAVLSLYSWAGTGTGDTWTVYSIKSANSGWTESGADGSTIDGSTPWAGSNGCSTSGTDYESTGIGSCVMNENFVQENQFSLTSSVVRTWFGVSNTNYGMVIFTNHASHSLFVVSSDSEPVYSAFRPKLVVDYDSSGLLYRRTFSRIGPNYGLRQSTY